jgi:hypothetical protein
LSSGYLEQVCQDGARQRRAFDRVGSGPEFVQDDERPRVGLPQEADDVGHVRREGAERLLDALLVADVGVDAVEDAQHGFGGRRDVQPGLGHQRQQADRLERDGLAAGVRPGDDQRVGFLVQFDVYRHDACRIEQRMAGVI